MSDLSKLTSKPVPRNSIRLEREKLPPGLVRDLEQYLSRFNVRNPRVAMIDVVLTPAAEAASLHIIPANDLDEIGSDPEAIFGVEPFQASGTEARSVRDLLRATNMLSGDALGRRIGVTRQAVDEMRHHGKVLAVPKGRRYWRYPAEQLGDDGRVLPEIERLIAKLGQGWRTYRFLMTRHAALDELTGREALADGRIEQLLDLADSYGRDFG